MSSRYEKMFETLNKEKRIAFVPFVVLGDPDLESSLEIVKTLIDNGADALELGFPFSDPIADGPVIQKASIRALESNVSIANCLALLKEIRQYNTSIPIGLLLYSNLVLKPGLHHFYEQLAEVGVDSILIADVPIREIDIFQETAQNNGIQQVLILPPDADQDVVAQVAKRSGGYVYLLSRAGVTGVGETALTPQAQLIEKLKAENSAPPIAGFGISKPEHVTMVKEAGAAGAIAGSAVVKIIEANLDNLELMRKELGAYVSSMRSAT